MKNRTEHLSIRITRKQQRQLLDTLKRERMTKSQIVRLALADYIEKTDN